jgi:hypothetical protein
LEPEIVCNAKENQCHCVLELEHKGPHICECKGSWLWEDGEFITYRLPGKFGGWMEEVLSFNPFDYIEEIDNEDGTVTLSIKPLPPIPPLPEEEKNG